MSGDIIKPFITTSLPVPSFTALINFWSVLGFCYQSLYDCKYYTTDTISNAFSLFIRRLNFMSFNWPSRPIPGTKSVIVNCLPENFECWLAELVLRECPDSFESKISVQSEEWWWAINKNRVDFAIYKYIYQDTGSRHITVISGQKRLPMAEVWL